MNFVVLPYDTLDSTNTEAIRQAKAGADEGVCIMAREQTMGRGRHGRTWASAKDAGLAFSVVLRPRFEARFLPLITLATGVAVHDALAEFGLEPDIKWVNDVLIGEKKICGILAETAETAKGIAVIAGIGINLADANFPEEIAGNATSIERETGRMVIPDEMAEILTRFFGYFYDMLSGSDGPSLIRKEWQRRSSYFSGKQVRAKLNSGSITGVTDGLESNGALRIRKDDGSVIIVQAGDVEQLRAQ